MLKVTCTAGCAWYWVSSTSCHRPDCLYECTKEIHKTACTSHPEDGQLDVQNVSKTL